MIFIICQKYKPFRKIFDLREFCYEIEDSTESMHEWILLKKLTQRLSFITHNLVSQSQ